MEYGNGSWSETVTTIIGIIANIVTIVLGLGKLIKLWQGRKEM
jgi:preprotein translocase subunit SecD